MNSEVRFKSPNLKITVTVGLILAATIIILAMLFRFEFGLILLAVAGSVGLIGVAGFVGIGGKVLYRFRLWNLDIATKQQDLRLATYKADRARLEAFVLSYPKTQRLVTLPESNVRVIEAIAEPVRALPPGGTQEPLDLLTVFTQLTQSYACIGGQQTGKTFQMRHIAAHWLNQGVQPVIVGPKWDRGEWAGCLLFGGSGNFAEVSKGITIVRQMAEKRHSDTTRSHKEHVIRPVFFDDWTPIVDAVDNARELVLQATTLYASVNIVLYFILHSDTANAWGVDRKGAALKDNFIKLFIVPHYDSTGLIVRNKTRGFIRFAGDSSEYPTKLFNGPVQPMESDDHINLEVEPTPTEAAILALYEQGQSHAKICESVWGYKSSNKYPEIDSVLRKFGAIE